MTAKQHIRAAIDILNEELKPPVAHQFTKRLDDVIWDLRKREECPRLFAIVNHADDMNHGLRLVKSGEGPEAA